MKPNDPGYGHHPGVDLARLEDELARLRPSGPSPQMLRRLEELRVRSADQARPRPGRWRVAALTGLAAGLVAAALVARLGGGGGEPGPGPAPGRRTADVRARPGDLGASEVGVPRFTVLAYRRALTRSPDDFDALLARDASDGTALAQPPFLVFAFGRPGVGPRSHEGEF